MRPYTAYLCTKLQGTQIMHFPLMDLDEKKKKEKNEETTPIFKVYILETPGTILLQFGMWGTDISTEKSSGFVKAA